MDWTAGRRDGGRLCRWDRHCSRLCRDRGVSSWGQRGAHSGTKPCPVHPQVSSDPVSRKRIPTQPPLLLPSSASSIPPARPETLASGLTLFFLSHSTLNSQIILALLLKYIQNPAISYHPGLPPLLPRTMGLSQ